MVVKWSSCAAEERISRIEVLIAVDRQRALLDKTGTDTVRTLAVFAPDRARPQSPGKKSRVVTGRTAPLHRDAIPIGEQHTTSNAPNRSMESVEARLSDLNERLNLFPGLPEFGIGQS